MKFLVDKALSPKVAGHLMTKGYETILVKDISQNAPVADRLIFDHAIDQNFIIITADVDFGQLLAMTHNEKPSVIIFRVVDQRTSNIIQKLDAVIVRYQSELEKGILLNVYDNYTRMYKLPIS